jgi:hypothetical protein
MHNVAGGDATLQWQTERGVETGSRNEGKYILVHSAFPYWLTIRYPSEKSKAGVYQDQLNTLISLFDQTHRREGVPAYKARIT